MRYQESTQRSAELLRMVLPQLARHSGSCHPTHYAVWYEYLAELNPRLKSELDKRLGQDSALSSDEIAQLYARFLGTRDTEINERMQQGLKALLLQLGTMTLNAGQEAEDYSRSLSDAAGQLNGELDAESLGRLIQELAARTTAIRASADQMRTQLASSSHEISTLKEQLDQVQSEAVTDPLTRLSNRRGFDRATGMLLGSRPAGLAGCTMLMADIDLFKSVNDAYGHVVGDQVIRSVAHVIHSMIKGGDLAARFGGEEFAILLPDTRLADAVALAEKIRAAVSRVRLKCVGKDDFIQQITISLGAAVGLEGESVEQLVQRADQALYLAKQSGRNRVEAAAAA